MSRPDDEAFNAFVRADGPKLLRLAAMLSGDERGGEDLLQTTLENVYGQWVKGDPPEHPYAYARAALVHAAQRSWRLRRRNRETLVSEFPDHEPAPMAGDRGLLREALLRALRRLPIRQRTVIALRYLDDYSEGEVAELLGCRVGTVKSHAHRGLLRLRDDPALAGYLDPVLED